MNRQTTHEKAQHTPGPWRALAGPPEYAKVVDADGYEICRCYREDDTAWAEKNAMRIAALMAQRDALLEACKLAVEQKGDWLGVLDAAIAQATGNGGRPDASPAARTP